MALLWKTTVFDPDSGFLHRVTVDQLRNLLSAVVGVEVMHVHLVRIDGGYELRAHTGYNHIKKAFVVVSEKSQKRRVFKTPQAAFRICQVLGLDVVTVEL